VVALRHPGVLLLLYLATTIPALIAVAPAAGAMDRAFAHHPDASIAWNQALDLDFARANPDLLPALGGGILFVVLAWTFAAGGILACVGVGRRTGFAEFMAAGGRAFFRNARVVFVFVLALFLWSWAYDFGSDRLQDWLRTKGSPARIFGARSALQLAYTAGFFVLSFAAHLAMAILSTRGGSSALAAWVRATGFVLRHPLQVSVSLAVMIAIWVLGLFLLGTFAATLLADPDLLWIGFAATQVGILYYQAGGIVLLVLARSLVTPAEILVPSPRRTVGVREVPVEPLEV
jgi:hypothetical protein